MPSLCAKVDPHLYPKVLLLRYFPKLQQSPRLLFISWCTAVTRRIFLQPRLDGLSPLPNVGTHDRLLAGHDTLHASFASFSLANHK